MHAPLVSTKLLVSAASVLATLAAISLAVAQTATETPAAQKQAPAKGEPAGKARVMPLADDGKGPDVAALRYYIAQGQKDRVEIEIKRLQTLYPTWQVPSSVYDTRAAGAVDEQPFWDLFAAGEMDRLRAEIAKRMREEPGWRPSDDLTDKIKRKEMRNQITALWKAGKWKDLVDFVKKEGYGGDDTDVDIMWTVAEAYARTKQTDDALGIYKSILKSNRNPDHRLATVQKAMATLRMSDVEELIKIASPAELAPIAVDITRARISAFLHDERTEEIPEAEMDAFKEYARKAEDADQPGLVAWYSYKRKVFPDALEWFKLAITKGGDSMIAHGLSHTLRELKLKRDTEEVAYAWREPLINNSILFVDILERDLTRRIPPYIEPLRLKRYAQVTMDGAAGEGAQGLGWYAYNTCQFKVALEWFQHAVSWHPKEATVYGLAITLRRLKMDKEFWELINRYDGLFPKVIEIIYPDDYEHPPTPCDVQKRKGRGAARAQLQANTLQQRPYNPYQALNTAQSFSSGQPSATPGLAPAGGPPPAWQMQQQQNYTLRLRRDIREPKISRKLFPVSVENQNPLRRWPVGRLMGKPAPAASIRLGPVAGLRIEPGLMQKQLVARRVPGVGAMPYERWGYQLLPGYNGQRTASEPHNAVKAPRGTLWTTLHAKDAQDTLGDSNFDPSTPDGARNLQLALEAIERAPRVPSPAESRNGPWSAPKAYKSQEQLDAEKDPAEKLAQQKNEAPSPASVIHADLTADAVAKSGKGIAPAFQAARAPEPTAQATPLKTEKSPAPQKTWASSARAKPTEPVMEAKKPAAIALTGGPIEIRESRPSEATGLRIETGARDELGRLATDLYNDRKYAAALQALDKRAARYPETAKLTLLRAWALLNMRRVEEARRIFAAIGRGPSGASLPPNRRSN